MSKKKLSLPTPHHCSGPGTATAVLLSVAAFLLGSAVGVVLGALLDTPDPAQLRRLTDPKMPDGQ